MLPSAAFAAGEIREPVSPSATQATVQTSNANPAAAPGTDAVIDVSKLDQYRGGTDTFTTTINKSQVNGTTSDNTATNIVSGFNAIADGAFANSSGFPTVIQNSGSNVLIQNSTLVNVQFK